LRMDELSEALRAAEQHRESFVGDLAGTGTTLYAAAAGVAFAPRFGGRSRAAHRAAGATELMLSGIPSVRRDVDTGVDLWDALRLGVGPRTKVVASRL
jgi:2-phospho-L-lactate/phosphoenolpyruvate guanylyltransferase